MFGEQKEIRFLGEFSAARPHRKALNVTLRIEVGSHKVVAESQGVWGNVDKERLQDLELPSPLLRGGAAPPQEGVLP